MTPAEIHAELFEHLPADTADEWTDAIVAIAGDHPPAPCPYIATADEGTSYCTLAAEPAGTLGEARSLLDAWSTAADDGEDPAPLRAQTLAWMEGS